MCNYSEMIAMKNLEYGKKEGIREGIIGAIKALSSLNHSPEEILGAISQQFALSMEDAEKYVKQTLF